MRMLPPLNPLRAFEAAGRHVSFTRAADELGVTQTAVSRQVAVLEAFLRCRLFERHNSALVITDAGRAYLHSVRPALETIADATAMTRSRSKNVVKVRVYLTFALRWLLPRLPAFRAAHPNIEINLTTSLLPVDFERDDLDVNICHGTGNWAGGVATQIFENQLTPLCAPSLMEGPDAPKTVEDLQRVCLLHSRNRIADWGDWFRHVGVEAETGEGITLETSSLIYEAARQGLGFAMGQVSLVKSELARGELIAPFPVMRRDGGYFLLHKQGRIEPKTAAFKNWILQQVQADQLAEASGEVPMPLAPQRAA